MSINRCVFVADGAIVLGDVTIGTGSSVWYNVVIRGDINSISIGKNTNIQDLCCLHVADDCSVVIGDDCVIGHQVAVHGATVGNRVLIGIGAILLNGVEVGDDSIIAAGALIPEGTKIPAGSLVIGMPGKVIRQTTAKEREETLHLAHKYCKLAESMIQKQKDRI